MVLRLACMISGSTTALETFRGDFIKRWASVEDVVDRTRETVAKARGGMLAIDLSDGLVGYGDDTDELGSVVLRVLGEELRKEGSPLVCVMGGCERDVTRTAETESLSGLFSLRLGFSSLTPDEIAVLSEKIVKDCGELLADGVTDVIKAFAARLSSTRARTGRSFIDLAGNGRLARNLMDAASDARDARLVSSFSDLSVLSDAELTTVLVEDVESAVTVLERHLFG